MTAYCCLNEFWKLKESELSTETEFIPERAC